MKRAVVAGKMEKCITVIILIQVAVPSPGSVGVRKMARSGSERIRRKGRELLSGVMPAGAGMGMDSSTVA